MQQRLEEIVDEEYVEADASPGLEKTENDATKLNVEQKLIVDDRSIEGKLEKSQKN